MQHKRRKLMQMLAAGFTIVSGLHYIWQGVHFLNAVNAVEGEESDEAHLLR